MPQKRGECTSPSLHPCHRLFDQDGRQDSSSLPIVQTLVPVTFDYSLSTEAVVMRRLRWWKRLWRRSLTRSPQENFHWAFQRLLERYNKCIAAGLEFHVCTINKKCPYGKSLETYRMHLILLLCTTEVSFYDLHRSVPLVRLGCTALKTGVDL